MPGRHRADRPGRTGRLCRPWWPAEPVQLGPSATPRTVVACTLSRPCITSAGWSRHGLAKQREQGLPLPRRALLRQDETGRVHDRGCSQSGWSAPWRERLLLMKDGVAMGPRPALARRSDQSKKRPSEQARLHRGPERRRTNASRRGPARVAPRARGGLECRVRCSRGTGETAAVASRLRHRRYPAAGTAARRPGDALDGGMRLQDVGSSRPTNRSRTWSR